MMRKVKKCIIHLGTPKTGTTSIQTIFSFNKDVLKTRSVLYPGSQLKHKALLRSLCNEFTLSPDEHSVLNEINSEIKKTDCETVFISDENFFNWSHKINFDKLKIFLENFFDESEFVICFRNPYDSLRSRCQEQIKSSGRTFEDLYERVYPLPIKENFEKIRQEFPDSKFHILKYEESDNHLFLPEFFKTLNIEFSNLKKFDRIRANESLSQEAAYLISIFNKAVQAGEIEKKQKFVQFIRGFGKTKFFLPKEIYEQKEEKLDEQILYLKENFEIIFTKPDLEQFETSNIEWTEKNTLELTVFFYSAKFSPETRV